MYEHIDIYCERLNPSFLAEPVNLFTNLLFVLAGCLVIYRASSYQLSLQLRIYGFLVALVGVASFSFHGFANSLTQSFDVISILFCVIFAIFFYGYYILHYKTIKIILLYLFLFSTTALSSQFLDFDIFNGSHGYFGVWLTLAALGLLDPQKPQKYITFQALALFSLSLVLRSIDDQDQKLCDIFPLGTHFLWHSINALLLYHLAKRFYDGTKKTALTTEQSP
ncbi:MAG: ceramidase domain-containing protein [Proteobacteria bacterium]|nr:ceramidase domain-containing protein [Pseudomonadota bacterium]